MLTTAQIDAIVAWAGGETTAQDRAELVEIVGGEGEPVPARQVVDAIIRDLEGRAGFDGAINGLDEDIRDEILAIWTRIVELRP